MLGKTNFRMIESGASVENAITGSVYISGDQNISGVKNFHSRPTVNGVPVLISGDSLEYAITGVSGYLDGKITNLENVTGGFALAASTGAFLTTGAGDIRYVQPSQTGDLINVFYPQNNPSGYITGVDLSSYSTIASTTGISGFLQTQISSNLSNSVLLTGNQNISGAKNFETRPTVQSVGVLLSGELFDRAFQEIWIDAGAMYPSLSGGATIGTGEYDYMSFSPSSDSYARFKMRFPTTWNTGSIKFQPEWTASTGSGTVAWTLATRGFSDGDNLSGALGLTGISVDTFLSSGVRHSAPISSVNATGSPNSGSLLIFEVGRSVANDTFSDNARLLGVQLQFQQTNAQPSTW